MFIQLEFAMERRRINLNWFRIGSIPTIFISVPLLVSLMTLAASGVEQPRSQPSKLDQLAYFEGNWLCQVQDIGTTNIESAGIITWNVIEDRDGKEYGVQGEYVRNRARHQKILIRGSMSYDGVSNRFVQIASANDGSKLIFNSKGWQAKTFIWQGVQITTQGDYLLRRTITKKDTRTFEAMYSGFDPTTSRWQPVTKLNCKK